LLNQNKIIQRTGVGDDEPHWSSESKPPKVIPIVIEVVERIRGVQIMSLEERIQRLSCPESEQVTQFRLREAPQSELFDRKRLQRTARQLARRPEAVREIVGNMNGHVHDRILWDRAPAVKKCSSSGQDGASASNMKPRRTLEKRQPIRQLVRPDSAIPADLENAVEHVVSQRHS
jgi:hypothetical protein